MKNQPFQPKLKINFLLLFFLFMACNTKNRIDIQGHRGCRGLFPENSLPAFEKAIDLGVNTLELDIGITKDKEVVVSHEPFMSRKICFNPAGNKIPKSMDMEYNLYKMSHDSIAQFDCGSKVHKSYPNQEKLRTYKPLLSEVFELAKAKKSDVRFNIEIKSKKKYYGIFTPHPKEYVEIVLDEVIKNNMLNRVIIQSFDMVILKEVRIQSPKMPIALLVDEDEDIYFKISVLDVKPQPEVISPYFELLDEKKVKNLQAANYKVIPWTVNDAEDLKRMVALEVDGIITDYPDRLIEILKE